VDSPPAGGSVRTRRSRRISEGLVLCGCSSDCHPPTQKWIKGKKMDGWMVITD